MNGRRNIFTSSTSFVSFCAGKVHFFTKHPSISFPAYGPVWCGQRGVGYRSFVTSSCMLGREGHLNSPFPLANVSTSARNARRVFRRHTLLNATYFPNVPSQATPRRPLLVYAVYIGNPCVYWSIDNSKETAKPI